MSVERTKRGRLEKKEADILAAATSVFLQSGLEGAKMADIAKVAGVAEGTLYLYFENKSALMRAITSEHWRKITKEAQEVIDSGDEPIVQMRSLASYHISMLNSDWKFVELNFQIRYGDLAGRYEPTKEKRAYSSLFDYIFQRGVDRREFIAPQIPSLARDFFFGGLEYAARTMMLNGHNGSIDQLANEYVSFFCKAFQAPPNQSREDAQGYKSLSVLNRLESLADRLEGLTLEDFKLPSQINSI